MELDLVSLYQKARRRAARNGYSEDADEFAAWYIIRIMEGLSKKQLMGHALIDYLREVYGSNNTKSKLRRVPFRFEDVVSQELSPLDKVIVTDAIEKLITPFEREILKDHFVNGKTYAEIGSNFGRSEAYISERIKIVRERLIKGKVPTEKELDSLRKGDPRWKVSNTRERIQEKDFEI